PGSTILYGASCVYDLGESIIVDTLITFPHILNPPQNPVVTVDEYAIFTWDPPEPGSTSPPHPLGFYNVYLDGVLEGVTNEQTWTFTDIVYGQTYLAEVCANYEAGSSELVGVEFIIPHILNPPLNVVLNHLLGIVFWEPPEASYATLIGYNVYLEGVLEAIVGIDVFEYQYTGLVPGQTYIAGVSTLYEEGESEIVEAWYGAPYICNPPTNASYEILEDHIHLTWQEPEPGSTFPFLNYRIYLDGELFETTELSYDIYDLISGQIYLVGLTALYEYLFESIPIEFEITFVGTDDVLTLETKLLGNYPNPFNPETTISFNISREDAKDAENVDLIIYNLKGQKIRTFPINQLTSQPVNHIIWDGRDENGNEVSSGIYLYKLRANHQTFTRKMLLIK
ncbi:MAG: T9SS type A sorting domain-containing protein, partial [Armatimonadetes bacterium]|nr:T9SS type A sorting domain-containing protein [Armatimonadota bacterium]